MRKLWVVTLIAISTIALAQEVPPPPRPRDDGPSLEVTMKYIQDRLQGQAVFSIEKAEAEDESATRYSYKILQLHTDPATCTLTFQEEYTSSWTYYGRKEDHINRSRSQSSYQLSFRNVEKLGVQGGDWYGSRIYYLSLNTASQSISEDYKCIEDCEAEPSRPKQTSGVSLMLNSEDTANRVAKAMLHAVELCGGGKGGNNDGDNDPFK